MGQGARDHSQRWQYLTDEPIDVADWHRLSVDDRDGASVEFLGIVRGQDDGRAIGVIIYEGYAPMAERVIARLVEQAQQRWPLHRVYMRHRIGRVPVGQAAVLVGVHAPHREEAFEACRFLIDAIKQDAPIWKWAFDAHGRSVEGHACQRVEG